ncbi:hypothetical protein OUZ56_002964 [Daphnia magna]|uniref:Uncharacterized protein n=1 Tax=Daphnia magna TaxID=35525 RepID=A0ABR0A7D6_9CRUS|nr:hypothetical protein OUZ56_002964 [Daphnia magna]
MATLPILVLAVDSGHSISFRGLNAVRQNMTTTPVRVQVPGLNLQQEIGSSIRYTSATCLTHSVATPSRYYLIKQRYNFIKITFLRSMDILDPIDKRRWGLPDTRETTPTLTKNCKPVYYPIHDPSNHTDKNIQSVYYSVRGITRDTLNRTDLPT